MKMECLGTKLAFNQSKEEERSRKRLRVGKGESGQPGNRLSIKQLKSKAGTQKGQKKQRGAPKKGTEGNNWNLELAESKSVRAKAGCRERDTSQNKQEEESEGVGADEKKAWRVEKMF
jgi:hypothetical protein